MNAAYSSVLVQNLKVTLLDQKRGAAPASMLDCAAHMLFCVDEPEAMYSAALRFMLERFRASRVDFGFGNPDKPVYIPNAVELVPDLSIPPFEGAFPNQIWPVQQVWKARGPAYQSLDTCPGIEKYWAGLGSKSKMARRLEVEDQVFGLICIDDTDAARGWDAADFGYFDQFITEFLVRSSGRKSGWKSRRYWRNSRPLRFRWFGCRMAAALKAISDRLGPIPPDC